MPVAIAVAALAVSIGGSIYSGLAQADAADEQAKLQDEQARQEQAAAQSEAEKIRDRGQRTAATQEAALAGSGVKLDGQGSGSALLTETKTLAEQDALAAITGGNNRAKLLNGEASISRGKGNAALISTGFNVGSTLLGGVNNFQKSQESSRLANDMNKKTLDIGSTYTITKPKYTLL